MHRSFGKGPLAILLTGLTIGALSGAAEGATAGETSASLCLTWDRATSPACPTVEEIAAAVRDTLGRPLAANGTCETEVTGSFRSDAAGGWNVDLHFASKSGDSLGHRFLEIEDAPCSALKEPLALVIALMVEGKSSDNAPLRVPRPPAPRSEAAATNNMTSISVGGAVSSGLTAGVGPGATLGVGSRVLGGLPLRLDTSFWFPARHPASGPSGEFWAWLGGVGVCPKLLQWRRFAVSACVRVMAGVVHGIGSGLDQIETATRPLGAAGLTGQLSLQIARRASLYLAVGAAASWLRARFVYRDLVGTAVYLHEPSLLIPLAELGIDVGKGSP